MKIVSATEAKNRLGGLIGDLANGEDAVIIEHHGHPRAVIVSAEEWEALLEARKALQQREAWERIKQAAAELGARSNDLSQDEIDAIADDIGDEAKRRAAISFVKR
jgi:prevent-host-death family protein